MQFQNCAAFNKWNLADQLAFLRRALDNKATYVLWDYNEEEVNSVTTLKQKLRHRFGGASQPEKKPMEAKCRRESQSSLGRRVAMSEDQTAVQALSRQ